MKTNIVLLASVTASFALAACQFQAGTGPQTPATPATPGAGATPGQASIPAPPAKAPPERVANMRKIGLAGVVSKTPKMKDVLAGGGGTTPTGPTAPTSPTTPPTTPPAPAEPAIVTAATPFGGGDAKEANFLGSIYEIAPNADKVPDLGTLKPIGTLFAKELNVPSAPFTEGFAGVTKKAEWFAIRYEAPLTVTTAGDYDLTINSDDGAVVYVNDQKIVDNDGVHAAAEKTGPVHLDPGTHSLRIDYFQAAAGPVALQFYCNKMGAAKVLCTGKL